LNRFLKIDFKDGFFDQPNLTNLETYQFTISEQTAKVLLAIATYFCGNLDGYVVIDHKGKKQNPSQTSLGDDGQFL